jgi:hypothetical protein
MKIFVACSKHFYHKIPEIKEELESQGHEVALPNSYDRPLREEEIKKGSLEGHIQWKAEMMRRDKENIEPNDAILVLNLTKQKQPNYIGGATFLEMYKAWEMGKLLFLYNPIPQNNFADELTGMNPTILNGDLKKIK